LGGSRWIAYGYLVAERRTLNACCRVGVGETTVTGAIRRHARNRLIHSDCRPANALDTGLACALRHNPLALGIEVAHVQWSLSSFADHRDGIIVPAAGGTREGAAIHVLHFANR